MPNMTKYRRDESEQTVEEWQQHMRWRPVLLKAIALSWQDAQFREMLLKDPQAAFDQWNFNWQIPEHLDLSFALEEDEDHGFSWDEDAKDGSWERLPPSKLTVVLPNAPPAQQQAIALADFNDAGRVYPFTCC